MYLSIPCELHWVHFISYKHMRLRDTLISYMQMVLRWFYDTLVLNKLRVREYLIQVVIALKVWVDLHI